MAKTLEELQDAIKNVIAENDKGEITATALQTILLDMSETLSELGGSNETVNNIILASSYESLAEGEPFLTDEDKAHNKIIYDNLIIKPFPVVLDMSAYGEVPETNGNYDVYNFCITSMYSVICNEDNFDITSELQTYVNTIVILIISEMGDVILCNDGNIIMFGEE